jgi:hypothetical protein
MKIFRLFKEIQAIRDVLTLIFTQQIELNHKLSSMQSQLDKIQLNTEPIEETSFEGIEGDIKISEETYRDMCECLGQEDIDLMGIS